MTTAERRAKVVAAVRRGGLIADVARDWELSRKTVWAWCRDAGLKMRWKWIPRGPLRDRKAVLAMVKKLGVRATAQHYGVSPQAVYRIMP